MTVGQGMNASQVRVVDPILSEHARGYSNAAYVGHRLFPTVNMPTRAAKRIEFDRSSFRRRRTRRAPGGRIAMLEFGYEGLPVALHQEALQAVVPIEHQQEADQVPGLNLQRMGVDIVSAVIALEKEIDQAETARNAASYGAGNKEVLAGGDQWSDPTADLKTQIFDAKEVIRKRIGRRPNVLLATAPGISGARKNEKILDHYKHTNDSAISDEMLAGYFDLDAVVSGDAIYDTDDATTVDVWGTEAILAYVAPEGQRSMPLPSYGYTYQLAGHPFVTPYRWDGDFRSWKADDIDEFSAELVGADAGYLFQSVV